jgi:N-acetylmuramoyl-L-alanine amidase
MKGALQDVVTPRAPVPGASGAGEDGRTTPDTEDHVILRPTRLLLLLTFLLLPAAPAAAAVPHVVQPGETLWSISAANNLTTRTVAAFNGLSEDSQVVLGSTLMVPSTTEGYAALQQAGVVPAEPAQAAPAAPAAPAAATPVASGAPAPQGGYTVRPGDTLSALAAQTGTSVSAMAAMNGLDPNGLLLTGTVLKLPGGSAPPAQASAPAPAETVVPDAAPAPTPQHVSATDVQNVAASHGVSPSLAAAIAWQESGFNNSMVSSANARGVMQVMPGTWDYVQQNLAGGQQLDPNSANDNIHAGVMYLKRLLTDAGGDENAAIAGYYQGLASVRERGMYDDTARYVDNVQALRSRFGG